MSCCEGIVFRVLTLTWFNLDCFRLDCTLKVVRIINLYVCIDEIIVTKQRGEKRLKKAGFGGIPLALIDQSVTPSPQNLRFLSSSALCSFKGKVHVNASI